MRRRNLMAQKSGYSLESAVLWLDCIWNAGKGVHDDSAKTIVDLTGNGNDASIIGTLKYDDGYVFNGKASNYINVPPTAALDSATELTYEFCFYAPDVTTTQRFLYTINWFEIFMRSGFNVDFLFEGSRIQLETYPISTGLNTAAVLFKDSDYKKVFLNAVEIYTKSASAKTATCQNIFIGQGRGAYPVKSGSKFFSLRAYDRVLTNKELQHNYEIDKQRFGITV